MTRLNWLVVVLTAPLGFIAALVVALVIELWSNSGWIFAVLFALFFIGIFVFDKVVDVIWDPIMNRLFRAPREDPAVAKQESRWSRYAFVAGFLLGLAASWIWSAGRILELISRAFG